MIDQRKLAEELIFSQDGSWWNATLNQAPQVRQASSLPSRVTICDQTLREGEETPGVYLEMKDRIAIARKLEAMGVPEAEIGYLGAIQEHSAFATQLKREGTRLKLMSHTRTYVKEDEWRGEIDRSVEGGADILCLVASASETLRATTPWLPTEAVPDRVAACTEYARSLGAMVAVGLVDTFRTPLERIAAVYGAAAGAGARRVYVMDGQGIALPETVAFVTRHVRQSVGPEVEISAHCHDDFGLATANTLTAIREGASAVDVVVNGLGDKAGIGAFEEVVMALEVLYGIPTGIDLTQVYELSKLVERVFRVPLAANKAIVGDNIVRHQIDAHVATVLRGVWWAWEDIKPEYFGRQRSLEWAYGKVRRGRSGSLMAKIESMGLQPTDQQYDAIAARLREEVERSKVLGEQEVETLIRSTLQQS